MLLILSYPYALTSWELKAIIYLCIYLLSFGIKFGGYNCLAIWIETFMNWISTPYGQRFSYKFCYCSVCDMLLIVYNILRNVKETWNICLNFQCATVSNDAYFICLNRPIFDIEKSWKTVYLISIEDQFAWRKKISSLKW